MEWGAHFCSFRRKKLDPLAFFSRVVRRRTEGKNRKRAGSNEQSRHLRCAINERVFVWSSFANETRARYASPPHSSLLVLTSRLIYNELLFFNPGRKCQPSSLASVRLARSSLVFRSRGIFALANLSSHVESSPERELVCPSESKRV